MIPPNHYVTKKRARRRGSDILFPQEKTLVQKSRVCIWTAHQEAGNHNNNWNIVSTRFTWIHNFFCGVAPLLCEEKSENVPISGRSKSSCCFCCTMCYFVPCHQFGTERISSDEVGFCWRDIARFSLPLSCHVTDTARARYGLRRWR